MGADPAQVEEALNELKRVGATLRFLFKGLKGLSGLGHANHEKKKSPHGSAELLATIGQLHMEMAKERRMWEMNFDNEAKRRDALEKGILGAAEEKVATIRTQLHEEQAMLVAEQKVVSELRAQILRERQTKDNEHRKIIREHQTRVKEMEGQHKAASEAAAAQATVERTAFEAERLQLKAELQAAKAEAERERQQLKRELQQAHESEKVQKKRLEQALEQQGQQKRQQQHQQGKGSAQQQRRPSQQQQQPQQEGSLWQEQQKSQQQRHLRWQPKRGVGGLPTCDCCHSTIGLRYNWCETCGNYWFCVACENKRMDQIREVHDASHVFRRVNEEVLPGAPG